MIKFFHSMKDAIFFELFPSQPSKGDLKRFEIIRMALACFAKDGFEGGTFESIAKKLKTRRSHIVYYFADKDELFTAVIHFIIAHVQKMTVEYISKAQTPLERIMAMSDAAFDWSSQNPQQARVLLLFYYSAATESKYRKIHSQIREAGYARIDALLQEEFKSRGFKEPKEKFSRALHSMMTGFVLDFVTTDIGNRADLKSTARFAYTHFFETLKKRS
ncbi:MAG: TetR/AcrR family transcriptional regulator [Pseudobdellovibrionaceae bacterium]